MPARAHYAVTVSSGVVRKQGVLKEQRSQIPIVVDPRSENTGVAHRRHEVQRPIAVALIQSAAAAVD